MKPDPGITRKKRSIRKGGKSVVAWDYFDVKGKKITNQRTIHRCNSLVLPPAWTDVWISPDADSHLQATGKDAKGRLQYRYHQSWTAARSAEKFDGMAPFAKLLPHIRRQVIKDLKRPGMPKEKVVALIIQLIDRYHFRVGNDEYARANNSYGLTTLKKGHVTFDRSRKAEGKLDAVFEFVGKSGKLWKRRIWEDDLALLIDQSGKVGDNKRHHDLFRYEDGNGHDFDVKSNHVNEYLDKLSSEFGKVTAKDFRTWAATWKTAFRLSQQQDPQTVTARKKVLNQIIKTVSSDLENTPAVCRSSYIHPSILSDWSDGKFRAKWNKARRARKVAGLSAEESVALRYLAVNF